MPKFAPNTGFKMPGVGSKNIDSPGNFRDEQHVDKVGYCDTTDDRMLPEGSSPLKVRYASSGYLKDLDAITIPSKKSGCPKGSKLIDGKCVKTENNTPDPAPAPKPVVKKKEIDFDADREFKKISYDKTVTVAGKTPSKTTYKPPTRTDAGDLAYSKLTQAQKDKQDADYIRINTKTTGGGSTSLTGKTSLKKK